MNARLSTRIRRVVVVLLVVLGLAAVGPPSAVASPLATYLALGDSVPFGFRALTDLGPYGNPDNFVGYPEIIARDLGLNLLNASCPGESTDSFIDASRPSNGCENFYRAFPLHVNYLGAQLAYAVHVLETTPNVKLVTVQLGANDGFLCQASTADGCTSPAEIAALAGHIQANMASILRTLRQTGYTGRIVAVTYYSPNYADPVLTGQVLAINSAIGVAALLNGTGIASGFLAFLGPSLRAGGSPVAAKLTISNTDIHPTYAGQRLLATTVEQAVRL